MLLLLFGRLVGGGTYLMWSSLFCIHAQEFVLINIHVCMMYHLNWLKSLFLQMPLFMTSCQCCAYDKDLLIIIIHVCITYHILFESNAGLYCKLCENV